MHYLCWNKIICCLLSICFCKAVNAQQELNLLGHDEKPIYFGISLSYNRAQLLTVKSAQFLQQDTIKSANPLPSHAIAFGLHATARLSNHFELRFNPQLILGSAYRLAYTIKGNTLNKSVEEMVDIPTTVASFALQLKFISDRIGNFKVYVLGGVKYDINLAGNDAANTADKINLNKQTYGLELGVGCSFYLKHVIVSPEIKLSHALNNSLITDKKSIYNTPLRSIYPYFTFFTIHFEG